jgi:hypothetical protein
MQVGAKILIPWRMSMLAAVGAGSDFLLDGLVAAAVVTSYGLVSLLSCYAICC